MQTQQSSEDQTGQTQKTKNLSIELIQVWGDTVNLRELLLASILGITLTLGFYFGGKLFFARFLTQAEAITKGYALMAGILGCVLSGAISARLFEPKRHIEERQEEAEINELLEEVGISREEEAMALATADRSLIQELEGLELYSLLALIPEGTANYDPSYAIKAKGGQSL